MDILDLFANSQMKWIVILIAIDFALAVIAAIIKNDFSFAKLGNVMKIPVLGYILGFAVIESVGISLPSINYVVSVVFILIVVALLASIIGNIGKLGVPVPKSLKK